MAGDKKKDKSPIVKLEYNAWQRNAEATGDP